MNRYQQRKASLIGHKSSLMVLNQNQDKQNEDLLSSVKVPRSGNIQRPFSRKSVFSKKSTQDLFKYGESTRSLAGQKSFDMDAVARKESRDSLTNLRR